MLLIPKEILVLQQFTVQSKKPVATSVLPRSGDKHLAQFKMLVICSDSCPSFYGCTTITHSEAVKSSLLLTSLLCMIDFIPHCRTGRAASLFILFHVFSRGGAVATFLQRDMIIQMHSLRA